MEFVLCLIPYAYDSKCPGDASCYCAFQCAAWVRIPIPTYFRSQEVYITGLIPSGVSWLGNTLHDVVIVMPPHCVILVWVTVWCFLIFVIHILVLLDALMEMSLFD